MRLKTAAKYFDRLPFSDAYSGAFAFKGQFDLFDDAKKENQASQRRIISMAPEVVTPVRNAVADGQYVWILGEAQVDYFGASPIRKKYAAVQSQGLANTWSLSAYVNGAAETQAHCSASLWKVDTEKDTGSRLLVRTLLSFAASEPVDSRHIVELLGVRYYCQEVRDTELGIKSIYAEPIDSQRVSATRESRVFDPVSDTFSGATASGFVLLLPPHLVERVEDTSGVRVEVGDVFAALSSSLLPATVGDRLTVSGQLWTVLLKDREDSSVVMLRRSL